MREILFRGKRKDNGKWVEGYIYEHQPPLQCIVPENYVPEQSRWYIVNTAFADWHMPREVEFIEIDPATVGQYTELTDKKGKKIFEGDIVLFDYIGPNRGVHGKAAVAFNNGKFGVFWGWHQEFVTLDGFSNTTLEVIGNIHDNPELLEVRDE